MDEILNIDAPAVQPKMRVMQVTPDIARAWLQRNTGNRPFRRANANKVLNDIKRGGWKMTGDAIRFSKSGKLIDGQHRLTAVVESGITVETLVISGLDDEIFDVIDTGAKRGKSDVVAIEFDLGADMSRLVSSAAGMALHYERGFYSFRDGFENHEVLSYLRSNPALIFAAQHVRERVPHESPAPKSIAAMFWFFASRLDPLRADRFLERFMVGAVDGADDNLLHMRNALFSARAARRPIQTREIIGRLIKIWNSERKGKPIKYFNNTGLRADEAFPKFI